MDRLPDDATRAILDALGVPSWPTVRRVNRDLSRVLAERITWAPHVHRRLRWTYATGHGRHVACEATDVVEVAPHEPQYNYRTFALTPTSAVSTPHYECVRQSKYVHIHASWIYDDDTPPLSPSSNSQNS